MMSLSDVINYSNSENIIVPSDIENQSEPILQNLQ